MSHIIRSKGEKGRGAHSGRKDIWRRMKKNYVLYLLLLPAVIYIILFHYAPMYGIQMAFRDYIPAKGMWGSNWVGLKHFFNFIPTILED